MIQRHPFGIRERPAGSAGFRLGHCGIIDVSMPKAGPFPPVLRLRRPLARFELEDLPGRGRRLLRHGRPPPTGRCAMPLPPSRTVHENRFQHERPKTPKARAGRGGASGGLAWRGGPLWSANHRRGFPTRGTWPVTHEADGSTEAIGRLVACRTSTCRPGRTPCGRTSAMHKVPDATRNAAKASFCHHYDAGRSMSKVIRTIVAP